MTYSEPARPHKQSSLIVRTGLVVWLLCGVALLVGVMRGQFPAPASAGPPVNRPVLVADRDSLAGGYKSDYKLQTGNEILLVFVGGSFCGAQRRPGFPRVVDNAKLRLQEQAKRTGRQFRAVAVSLDWDPGVAHTFLKGFGKFDEMSLGGNWVSDGAVKYVWREMPGEPLVPQVIIVERHVDTNSAGVRVTSERVVKRVLGAAAIEGWVKSGARL